MRKPPSAQSHVWKNRRGLRLFLIGMVCWGAGACGYRWVGANPVAVACLLPVENLSTEVGAGQVFDVALRSQLLKAGGGSGRGSKEEGEGKGGGASSAVVSQQGCLQARLMQVSREFLTIHDNRVTHFRLTAVLELSLDKEGFSPIRVVESEEFSYGADILLTEASLRAALVRLADKTAQKGFEHLQMQ